MHATAVSSLHYICVLKLESENAHNMQNICTPMRLALQPYTCSHVNRIAIVKCLP